MKKRLVLRIYGEVQGVNFRSSIKFFAQNHSITGWVKNENDGSVELAGEGEEENLQALLDFCYNGVEDAHIQQIDSSWENPSGEFHDFSIRRNFSFD